MQMFKVRSVVPWSHITHNFIHLLKRQHNYTQKNECENLSNQHHSYQVSSQSD